MKNIIINFSGSFIGYMNSIFPEISLSDTIRKINTNIKKNLTNKNEDFNEYKIIFGNNFYGYEHAKKEGKEKINEVMIQDLFSDKEKSIIKLSEIN